MTKFKLGDKVLVEGEVREIIPTCSARSPLYGVRLNDGVVVAQADNDLHLDIGFSNGTERKEQCVEPAKDDATTMPNVEICTFGEGCKIVDGVCFSDGADIEERYAESVKNEVPDEEVPKELHPAVEKFKKLLDDTMVNHPPHYTAGKVECIDALEAATTGLQGIEAVCTANAIKYLWRQSRKNSIEDLKKCIWYVQYLIDYYERKQND